MRYFTVSTAIAGVLLLAAVAGCATGGSSGGIGPAYGQLSVVDGQLRSEEGNAVQLKGMSTMGLQWYGEVVNPDAFDALVRDWEVDVIRLALYVGEGGYSERPELKDLVRRGIELAIERGVYVIVDWHVLTPGNPNDPIYAGVDDFFDEISRDYGSYPNVIYEIMNEPNGNLSWSRDLKPYAERLVQVIRKNDPDNIILIGSGTWSQDVDIAAADPVDGENLMYTVHFYSGTHGDSLRAKIDRALDLGVAVFSSEWGTSLASGTGGPFIEAAEEWLEFFDQRGISWVNWSLANKNETSAAFKGLERVFDEEAGATVTVQEETPLVPEAVHPDGYKYWPVDQLSVSGAFARAKIKGLPTPTYFRSVHEWNFESGDLQSWTIADDSPVKPSPSVLPVPVSTDAGSSSSVGQFGAGYEFSWSSQRAADTWATAPRFRVGDVDLPLAGVNAVRVVLLLESDKEVTGPMELNAILQYPPSYWTQLTALPFGYPSGVDLGNGYRRFELVVPASPSADTVLSHMQLILVGAGSGYEGKVIFDSVSLVRQTNGEPTAEEEAGEADDPGSFSGLPWDFEAGGRQGWIVAEDSPAKVQLRTQEIGSTAISFGYGWSIPGPSDPWNAAPRLSSSWVNLPAEDYETLSMEVLIEDLPYEGAIQIQPVVQSPQHGYWFQLSAQDLTESTLVETVDGFQRHRLEFGLVSNTGANFAADAVMRNLILITIGIDTAYQGTIAYDNISFD